MGMRRAFVLAAGVFVVGAAICAPAPTMPVLVAGRGLQGLGGGMLIAGAHSMVRELFPEALWPRMLTAISCTWAIPALSGPAVGGVLAERGLLRTALWAVAPTAVLVGALTSRILPETGRGGAGAARV